MKIGLVIPSNIKYSPYVNYYIDILKRENVDYRLLVWDKVGIDEDADMTFRYKSSDFDRKRILAGHYLFARRCRAFIREEKIDHLIVFTIAPLFFLGYRFLSHFRGDIIIDIRDDSPFRRNFKKQLDKICQLAENVIVSSPYYAKWLSRKCIQCHNADMEMLRKYRTVDDKKVFRKPFRLVYAGMMIEEDANIQLIQQLGNKEEFVMTYVGRDNPGKDKIIRLCLAAGLDLEETQRALKVSGMPILYPRDKKDATVIFAIEHGLSVISTNELLYQNGLEVLN